MTQAVAGSAAPRGRPSSVLVAALLGLAAVMSLAPCVMLPDVSGPLSTPQGRVAVAPFVRFLLVPPERFREHILRQTPTFIIVEAEHGPGVWWLKPPFYTRMALRHFSVAWPFWFTVLLAAVAATQLVIRRFRPRNVVS